MTTTKSSEKSNSKHRPPSLAPRQTSQTRRKSFGHGSDCTLHTVVLLLRGGCQLGPFLESHHCQRCQLTNPGCLPAMLQELHRSRTRRDLPAERWAPFQWCSWRKAYVRASVGEENQPSSREDMPRTEACANAFSWAIPIRASTSITRLRGAHCVFSCLCVLVCVDFLDSTCCELPFFLWVCLLRGV